MKRYAYFSQQHSEATRRWALFSGVTHGAETVWASVEGKDVICTCVGSTPLPQDSLYAWPDAVPLGEVTHWVRGVAA